jgi:5-methyltetrahydropteroyltriglutamate--homocysteine methyltransferase
MRSLEDMYIVDALNKQRELGFQIFTDGEFRRASFMSDFNAAIEGLNSDVALSRQWSGTAAANFGIAVNKIRARGRMTAGQVDFLKAHAPGDIKMTLPSANQFPALAFKKGVSDKVYGSFSEFLWDCVPVIKAEVQALVKEVQYVQLDAPRYSYYIDPRWRRYVQDEMEMDPETALDEAIRADNACLEGTGASGVTRCIHLCRGNNRSQWYAEGGYDAIAEKLFNQLDVDAFSLEYDTERAGTFEPLRFVPKGKIVVLGLISSKVPELESADEIVSRIEEAAKYVPLEYLTLSPQCGFASMAEGNLLSEDDQWRKLELVAEVARRVWGTT